MDAADVYIYIRIYIGTPVSLHTFIFSSFCDIIFIGFYLMMKRKNSTSKARKKKNQQQHTRTSESALASVNFDVVTRTTSVRGQKVVKKTFNSFSRSDFSFRLGLLDEPFVLFS